MKLTKKIVLGALAAIALVLTGCEGTTFGGDPDAEDSVNGSIIKGVTSKAYVGERDGNGYENTSGSTIREMQLFTTKHYGAFAALTLKGEDKTSAIGNGQLGYVFNFTENDDDTVNFITIGFRWNNKKLDTYVSQYYNIDKTKFSTQNFGAPNGTTANKYDKDKTTPYECVVKQLPTVLDASKFGTLDADGSATIGVEVIAENNGTYTINYYSSDDLDDNYKLKEDAFVDYTVTVPADVTGRTTKKQTKMGCYAAVYAGKTLNGFWRFSNIKGEDIPVEE